MSRFTSESDFMNLAFNLVREATSYLAVAASTLGPKPVWSRDQAVVGGNMVRLFKLMNAFLDQTAQKRPETSTILSRLVFETIVNSRYLIANFSQELIASYCEHSLRHERRLWDTIQSNVKARAGVVLPIEDRMMRSINRAAKVAGFSIEAVDPKAKGPWGGKDLRKKAAAVGLEEPYLAVFGGMSHNVHGAWQDLDQFHLEEAGDDTFTPRLDWGLPRPQALFALGVLSLGAATDFFAFIGGQDLQAKVQDHVDDLIVRLHQVNDAHEAYLQARTWPAI